MEDHVKGLEDQKVGSAVIVQGYVFRDLAGVKAWDALSGNRERFRFMRNCVSQLTMAVSNATTTGGFVVHRSGGH